MIETFAIVLVLAIVVLLIYAATPFITKLMGIFFNMDRMIGRDFEAGLADLKTAAERA